MEVLSILELVGGFLLVFAIDAQVFVASTGYCSANIRFHVRLGASVMMPEHMVSAILPTISITAASDSHCTANERCRPHTGLVESKDVETFRLHPGVCTDFYHSHFPDITTLEMFKILL